MNGKIGRIAEEKFLDLVGQYAGFYNNETDYTKLHFELKRDGSLGKITVQSEGYVIKNTNARNPFRRSLLTLGHWRVIRYSLPPVWIAKIRNILNDLPLGNANNYVCPKYEIQFDPTVLEAELYHIHAHLRRETQTVRDYRLCYGANM